MDPTATPTQSPPPRTEEEQDAAILVEQIVDLEDADEKNWKDVLRSFHEQYSPLVEPVLITQEEKEQLATKLTNQLIDGLKKGKVTTEELPDIASYIVDNIERINTANDKADFLYVLPIRFPLFSTFIGNSIDTTTSARDQITQLADVK
jgi:hypothetical protein